ncbi:hypothetical protein EDD16DRAFT_1588391, partial [Pisolithus croceorrhizus]
MADCLTLIFVCSFSVDAFLFIIMFMDVMDFGPSVLLSGPCLPVVYVPMCLNFFCILMCDTDCSVFHHVSPEHTQTSAMKWALCTSFKQGCRRRQRHFPS